MLPVKLEILMATYNGEAWLDAQMESLLAQEGIENWTLSIQDDRSTDDTLKILETWRQRYPSSIQYTVNAGPRGPAANFSSLLQRRLREGQAQYFLFCDQDDVWHPWHLRALYEELHNLNLVYGADTPCLAHGDLEVCDGEMRGIAASFWKHQALDPKKNSLNRLLLQNVVTGCATGINRALAERAGPVPEEAIMHDWWLALVASALGHIKPVSRKIVRYRVHGGNACGTATRALSWTHIRSRLKRGGPGLQTLLQPYYRQARVFSEQFQGQLSVDQQASLRAFQNLADQGWWEKRLAILRHGFWKQEWIRNMAWFLRV